MGGKINNLMTVGLICEILKNLPMILVFGRSTPIGLAAHLKN